MPFGEDKRGGVRRFKPIEPNASHRVNLLLNHLRFLAGSTSRQRLLPFAARERRLARMFKRAIVLTTAVVGLAIMFGTPIGRFAVVELRLRGQALATGLLTGEEDFTIVDARSETRARARYCQDSGRFSNRVRRGETRDEGALGNGRRHARSRGRSLGKFRLDARPVGRCFRKRRERSFLSIEGEGRVGLASKRQYRSWRQRIFSRNGHPRNVRGGFEDGVESGRRVRANHEFLGLLRTGAGFERPVAGSFWAIRICKDF